MIKPYAVLFLPWLVARRRLPSMVSACVGLAVVLALPAALYGWEGNAALHREWWRTVTETTAPNLSLYDNVSLAAMYFRWVGPGPCRRASRLAPRSLLLGLVALVFIGRRGIPFPEGIEGAMLLTLMPLLSPQGWHYVFLIATPAIVYLANYEDLLPRPLRVAHDRGGCGDRLQPVRPDGPRGVLDVHATVDHQPLLLRGPRGPGDAASAKDRLI